MSHTTYEAPYVLAAQSWRRTAPSSPWHIMRVGVTTPAPMMEGLCGTETQGPQHAEVVRAGHSPLGGRLCDRCRKLYNRGGAYEAQGPRPEPMTEIVITEISIEHPHGYGGHEFEYDSGTDLFCCVHCGSYEAMVRDPGTGQITRCPGAVEP